MKEFIETVKEIDGSLQHYFKVIFRNSNNTNFRDIQKDIILSINHRSLLLLEYSSREKIIEINLEEIMNWGINKEIFVLCYGDAYEVTKIYF